MSSTPPRQVGAGGCATVLPCNLTHLHGSRSVQLLHRLADPARCPCSLLPVHALSVDAGASYDAEDAAAWFGFRPEWRVVAFEPLPANCRRASTVLARWKSASLRCIALSDAAGEASFTVALEQQGSLFGAPTLAPNTSETIHVRVSTLDAEFATVASIFLLKLDLQGSEQHALRGAAQLLREARISFIYTEFDPHLLNHSGSSAFGLFATLRAHDFACRNFRERVRWPPGAWICNYDLPAGGGRVCWTNILCGHKSVAVAPEGPPWELELLSAYCRAQISRKQYAPPALDCVDIDRRWQAELRLRQRAPSQEVTAWPLHTNNSLHWVNQSCLSRQDDPSLPGNPLTCDVASAECATCGCTGARLEDMPAELRNRGDRPDWDEYLESVYGTGVVYPVALRSRFRWFYRCDCRTLSPSCGLNDDACGVVSELKHWLQQERLQHPARSALAGSPAWLDRPWRDSCGPAQVPLRPTPKVWLRTLPYVVPGGGASLEAFVGLQHRKFPNPEFWLAPFGWWLYPRAHPECLEAHRWIEVIRVAQPTETDSESTFYFHAPGSGIWLQLRRTVCCNNNINVDRGFIAHAFGAEFSPPRQLVGFNRSSSDPLCSLGGVGRARTVDTIQRLSGGNLLEVIDLAGGGANGTACGHRLRAGWSADRECRCDSRLLVLNCR